MIRLIQRRLIIPRGDTGSFSIPVLKNSTDNIAVFTIFDEVTHTKMFQKLVKSEGDVINIAFTHNDTVNLKPGKYVWDIKYYSNPEFVDEELVNGEEIDSYYAGFSLPVCEIRETADNYLVSPDAPSATLSPSQLDIITSAINGLNEAIRKTNENVEHYPEIRDEVWYVWDAEQGDYVSTNVRANGIVGNGIESAVLNNDYTLTLNFTDGTSFTSTSIRGETGNGIDDIVLNNDFTLTITYTDGDSYITPSIRGPVGATPQFSIGTVQDGAVAAASITGTAENPVLNLTLPNANVPTKVSELENDAGYLTEHQDLSDYVQKTDYATTSNAGIVKIGAGLTIDGSFLTLYKASNNQIKQGTASYSPIVPSIQERSTFYGLAKAAGDTTQSQSSNAVGAYTDEAKAAIQTMLDVPSNADVAAKQDTLTFDNVPTANSTNPVTSGGVYSAIANINTMKIYICAQGEYNAETGVPTVQNPDTQTFYLVPGGEGSNLFIEWAYVNDSWERFGSADVEIPVQDVQVNGTSILQNGVANVPATAPNILGVMKPGLGLSTSSSGEINVLYAGNDVIKEGTQRYSYVDARRAYAAAFYGLAKAAGDSTQSTSSNAVGTYTDEAKAAIQQMLDVPSTGDIPDVSTKADKTDTVLDTTLSRGRKANTTVGTASIAFGVDAEASGYYSTALGLNTSAVSQGAFAEGKNTVAHYIAHAEGEDTEANGQWSHSEGVSTVANGAASHAGGDSTIANGHSSFVTGKYNVADSYDNWPTWTANTSYVVGDKVKREQLINNEPTTMGYICKEANTDETFDISHWDFDVHHMNYSIIVGNGYEEEDSETHETVRHGSNAYALTWTGDGKYAGDVYVHANADSSGGVKLATVNDIPDVPVQDVQVNGTSILNNGVANVPLATDSRVGVVKPYSNYGITVNSNGTLGIVRATTSYIKLGTDAYRPITPLSQHDATFYGLAKAAGADMASVSNTTVGTYPDAQKEAIQSMLGITQMLAPTNSNLVASQAYAIGDVFAANGHLYKATAAIAQDGAIIPDTNCVETTMAEASGKIKDVQVVGSSVVGSDGIASVPIASANVPGVVKVISAQSYGVRINSSGVLDLWSTSSSDIKNGTKNYLAVNPSVQHASTFYGLSKVAGVDLKDETVTLGTYPETSKTAIKAMLGVQDGLKVVRLI